MHLDYSLLILGLAYAIVTGRKYRKMLKDGVQ